jgi:MFS transporter, DHA2 family, multidrug resistance protein
VIGSVAASLYASRLTAMLPAGLPARAITAARGSVGGAVIAAQRTRQAGFTQLGSRLKDTAILAFLHSFSGGCLVAGAVAAVGALVAIFLLPARPSASTTSQPDASTGPDQVSTPERQNVRALGEVI